MTKKLADAMDVKLPAVDENINPLFTWTANWTKGVEQSQDRGYDCVGEQRHTLYCCDLPSQAERSEKCRRDDEKGHFKHIAFHENEPGACGGIFSTSRRCGAYPKSQHSWAAWVTKAGLECAFYVGREFNSVPNMYRDTVGVSANYQYVNCSGNINEGYVPYEAMINALTEITGKQTYKYRALSIQGYT